MTSASPILGIAFFAAMALAAGWDLRARRIPNCLTIGAAVLAPGLWWITAGGAAATGSLLGIGAGLGVGTCLFALGAVGGGDAKLLMVLGAFLGPIRLLVALLFTGIIGGALGVAVAVKNRRLVPVLVRSWQLAISLVTLGRMGVRRTIDSSGVLTIPYGVAIAGGGLVTWFLWAAA